MNRALLLSMVKRDLSGRYKSSTMGLAWSVITPLMLLAVYTSVFGGILQNKWGGATNTLDFALQLFCGLTLFGMVSETLARSPSVLVDHSSYVKKVIFPLEILPPIVVAGAVFHAIISIGVLIALLIFVKGFSLTYIALPLVVLPLVVLCLGVAWFLSATTVYIRDVSQMTNFFSTILMFLSPIFYSAKSVPENFRFLYNLNPLTFPIEQLRRILLEGAWPDWIGILTYTLVSIVVAQLGFIWFEKTRTGFADVL